MSGVVHDFHERLEWSGALSDEASWAAFYRSVWPDMVSAVRLDGKSEWQTRGVDRIVYLESGRQFKIDEKKRSRDYGDVLLELWSVCQFDPVRREVVGDRGRRKVGWAIDRKKDCDFIAYATPDRVFLLPFETLRLTLSRFGGEWVKNPKWWPQAARNATYWTVSLAVPWSVLGPALCKTMERAALDRAAPSPSPLRVGGQIVFPWLSSR